MQIIVALTPIARARSSNASEADANLSNVLRPWMVQTENWSRPGRGNSGRTRPSFATKATTIRRLRLEEGSRSFVIRNPRNSSGRRRTGRTLLLALKVSLVCLFVCLYVCFLLSFLMCLSNYATTGCLNNDHCSAFEYCDQLTKECSNFRCPLDLIGGAIVPGSSTVGSESVLVCNDGFLLDFNNEPGVRVVCSAGGNWKSVQKDILIHGYTNLNSFPMLTGCLCLNKSISSSTMYKFY